MNKTGNSRWLFIALLSAGHFFSDFYNTFLPALLPAVTANLALSLTATGSLIMVYSLTSSILQPVLGYYIDKHGWTWLILLTIPASALFICLAGLVTTYWQLFACITLAGLASSLFHPLGSAMLNRATNAGNKGIAMALFIGGGNIGVAVAPAFVLYFLYRFGTEQLLWLALPGALLGLACYFGHVHQIPVRSLPQERTTNSPKTAAWYRSSNLLKLNVVMGLRSWPQAAIPNFLILWLTQQGQPTALAGGMLTVFLLGGALGSIGGGYVGDRYGRKNCIIASLLLCIPSLYFFLTAPVVIPTTYVLLGLSGAALQGTLPSSIIWAQEMLPSNAAMASGMMLGLAFGLGGLGAAVTGALADSIGLQAALLWTLPPLALASIITHFIPDANSCSPVTQQVSSNK